MKKPLCILVHKIIQTLLPLHWFCGQQGEGQHAGDYSMYIYGMAAYTGILYTQGLDGSLYTVFARLDAAATIYFIMQFHAATIRERRLFESGYY